jgi:NAD(P)H dehydrogenase (quinone)
MHTLIVYWHPEPRSFCGAMCDTARQALSGAGNEVKVSDLHAMTFDPVSGRHNFATAKDPAYFKQQVEEMHATAEHGFSPDIEAELQKVEWCDLMIWQFPLWWFSVPAVLKGWVDRVFAMGRAYGGGRIYDKGVFRGKKALLSLTTGGPEASYKPDGFNGDLAGVLRPIHRGMLEFVGFDVLAPQVVYGPVRMTDEDRRAALDAWAARLRSVSTERPIEVGRY